MIFCCQPDNDLYCVLGAHGYAWPRYAHLDEALAAAPPGSGVLALADDYPRPGWTVDLGSLDVVTSKRVRLYVEYPASLPGLYAAEPREAEWERLVVASEFFAPELRRLSILALHGCWFLPVEAPLCHLVLATVAGYDRAVYGLPDTVHPILFPLPGHTVLVATSKLSQFVQGRYAPQPAWKAVWTRLLEWAEPTESPPELTWVPTVWTQAGPGEPLDGEAEEQARACSTRWFREHIVYSIDWKRGAIEGFVSRIDPRGCQMQRTWVRSDCTAETAMVFAHDWDLVRDPVSRRLAIQILDYVWSRDFFQDDPTSPAYGLENWYERGPVFYGDDNARVVLATLATADVLGDHRWDERVLRCLLANLRTTGTLGFRRNRIDLGELLAAGRGWRSFRAEETVSYAPHYQAYLWAAYLVAYVLTGHEGFLQTAENAIRMTMDAYPGWHWTNGFTQETARMLLPLAFLYRVEATPAHREWMDMVAGDLLAQMQPSGGLYERLGPLGSGQYAPPQSNEAYGTSEASLIQENGDPASDLLYTVNYAFLGLHECFAATGDPRFREAEDRLAGFLCRIQVRSDRHPYLDGSWMRGFDDRLWEYWGSSADTGWGAWSVESGWTNTWINAVLAMRRQNSSLFDLGTHPRMHDEFPRLLVEMLPE